MSQQYEFTEQESRAIATVGVRGKLQSVLLGLYGILMLIPALLRWGEVPVVQSVLFIVWSLLFVFMGIVFYRPADNFKRVATTRGNDITEVMTGLREFNWGIGVLIVLISLSLVFDIANAVLNLGG